MIFLLLLHLVMCSVLLILGILLFHLVGYLDFLLSALSNFRICATYVERCAFYHYAKIEGGCELNLVN